MLSDVDEHCNIVQEVSAQVRRCSPVGLRFKKTGSLSHMTRPGRAAKEAVVLPRLGRIFDFDKEALTVWVEPDVTMDQLLRWCLRRGVVVPVVPDFKKITVGGAIMGAALESSSWRWGQFNDICVEYEVVTYDGQLFRCSSEAHSDLFYALAGSYGTLARIVGARVQLRPVKKTVRLRYEVVSTDKLWEVFQRASTETSQPDYLDAIVFSDEHAVVMVGEEVEESTADGRVLHLGRPWSEWFCQHVLSKTTQADTELVDWIPLEDYLFRYDRAAFWMGRFITDRHALWRYLSEWGTWSPALAQRLKELFREKSPTLQPGWLFRTLLAWKLSSRALYRALHRLPERTFADLFVVQDFYLPAAKAPLFCQYIQERVGIYPLWLCPVRGTTTPQILSPHRLQTPALRSDWINVGIYGIPMEGESVPSVTSQLEEKASELGGRKMLYGINNYSEGRFWQIYDQAAYDALRQRYHVPAAVPSLYERVVSR